LGDGSPEGFDPPGTSPATSVQHRRPTGGTLPVHRVRVSLEDGIAPLVDLIAALEADNDDILGVLEHAGEWVIVTKPRKLRRETR
jgi:hypothetical protein